MQEGDPYLHKHEDYVHNRLEQEHKATERSRAKHRPDPREQMQMHVGSSSNEGVGRRHSEAHDERDPYERTYYYHAYDRRPPPSVHDDNWSTRYPDDVAHLERRREYAYGGAITSSTGDTMQMNDDIMPTSVDSVQMSAGIAPRVYYNDVRRGYHDERTATTTTVDAIMIRGAATTTGEQYDVRSSYDDSRGNHDVRAAR